MTTQVFDRIFYVCSNCGNKGLIASVSVNLTYLILDGFCHCCRRAEATTFDLLEIDGWIRDKCDAPKPVRKERTGASVPLPMASASTGLCAVTPENVVIKPRPSPLHTLKKTTPP
jgi:hypothetical protein